MKQKSQRYEIAPHSLSINPLHFVERRSTACCFCYWDSQWIMGLRSAFTSGCVWYVILSYNAHAPILLLWWNHVTEVSATHGRCSCSSAQLSELNGGYYQRNLLAHKLHSLIRSFSSLTRHETGFQICQPAIFRNKLMRGVATTSHRICLLLVQQCIHWLPATIYRESHWCMFNYIIMMHWMKISYLKIGFAFDRTSPRLDHTESLYIKSLTDTFMKFPFECSTL